MPKANSQSYVDVYEQIIDEDPEDQSFEMPREPAETENFLTSAADQYEKMEEQAYKDLYQQVKKAKMIQRGSEIRTQAKRPLPHKLSSHFFSGANSS